MAAETTSGSIGAVGTTFPLRSPDGRRCGGGDGPCLHIPLVLPALWVLRKVPDVATRRPLSVDVVGGLLAVVGLGGVIYALTEAPNSGWTSGPVLATGLVGLLALAALVPVERRKRQPMLRTSLFRSRTFDAINVATLIFYGALAAAGYLVVLQCELQLGYSATAAGAALIPESAVFLIVSPLVGGLVARIGTRWPMAAGILLVAAGFAWLAAARPGYSYVETILPGAILWGLGIGLAVAPLTAGVLAAVDDRDLGEASGINDAASRIGGVVMIALVPVLLGAGRSTSLAHPLATKLPHGDVGPGWAERGRRADHRGVCPGRQSRCEAACSSPPPARLRGARRD